jgi:hypothetical protein
VNRREFVIAGSAFLVLPQWLGACSRSSVSEEDILEIAKFLALNTEAPAIAKHLRGRMPERRSKSQLLNEISARLDQISSEPIIFKARVESAIRRDFLEERVVQVPGTSEGLWLLSKTETDFCLLASLISQS